MLKYREFNFIAPLGLIGVLLTGGRGISHPDERVKVLPEFLSSLSRRGLVPKGG